MPNILLVGYMHVGKGARSSVQYRSESSAYTSIYNRKGSAKFSNCSIDILGRSVRIRIYRSMLVVKRTAYSGKKYD